MGNRQSSESPGARALLEAMVHHRFSPEEDVGVVPAVSTKSSKRIESVTSDINSSKTTMSTTKETAHTPGIEAPLVIMTKIHVVMESHCMLIGRRCGDGHQPDAEVRRWASTIVACPPR